MATSAERERWVSKPMIEPPTGDDCEMELLRSACRDYAAELAASERLRVGETQNKTIIFPRTGLLDSSGGVSAYETVFERRHRRYYVKSDDSQSAVAFEFTFTDEEITNSLESRQGLK